MTFAWNLAQEMLMSTYPDPVNSLLLDEPLERGIDLKRLHKEHDTYPAVFCLGHDYHGRLAGRRAETGVRRAEIHHGRAAHRPARGLGRIRGDAARFPQRPKVRQRRRLRRRLGGEVGDPLRRNAQPGDGRLGVQSDRRRQHGSRLPDGRPHLRRHAGWAEGDDRGQRRQPVARSRGWTATDRRPC